MTSADGSFEALRDLAKKALEESNELQARIDKLRAGGPEGQTTSGLTLMEQQHKQIGRDLIRRIEEIEGRGKLGATDRNMLQALNARLAVHDLQTARLAEHRDLLLGSKEWLDAADISGINVSQEESEPVTEINASGVEGVEEEDPLPPAGKDTWPILYRIIDVDPKTPAHLFKDTLDHNFKALSHKHDPERFPNDPTAEERFKVCNKAYNILADPQKRQLYDTRGVAPRVVVDFDLSKLSLNDSNRKP